MPELSTRTSPQVPTFVVRDWGWIPATATCKSCGSPWMAGHICPLPIRDLSPLGGGPKP